MSDGESETFLSKQIRQALEANGYLVGRNQAGKGRYNQRLGDKGSPDLWVIGRSAGFLGFLEVKTKIGRLSAAQILYHDGLKRRGVNVAVVRSSSEAVQVVGDWAKEMGDG